jgi:hypothetical protein
MGEIGVVLGNAVIPMQYNNGGASALVICHSSVKVMGSGLVFCLSSTLVSAKGSNGVKSIY